MIEPLRDVVIVRPLAAPQVTASGLFLPEERQRETFDRGVVEQVGPGVLLDSGLVERPGVEPGDVVFYGRYSGSEIVLQGRRRLAMPADQVTARIPSAAVHLVAHELDDRTVEHLEGEPCPHCARN